MTIIPNLFGKRSQESIKTIRGNILRRQLHPRYVRNDTEVIPFLRYQNISRVQHGMQSKHLAAILLIPVSHPQRIADIVNKEWNEEIINPVIIGNLFLRKVKTLYRLILDSASV